MTLKASLLEWRGRWFCAVHDGSVRASSIFEAGPERALAVAAGRAGTYPLELQVTGGHVERDMRGYLEGGDPTSTGVEPPDLWGEFQRAVWSEVSRIPLGTTRIYSEVAEAVGRPAAARAVGNALNANPAPLFVPCHRVVAADGLGGFSAGKEAKRTLLELEGAV